MIRNWLDEEFGLYEINNLEIIGEEDKNKKNTQNLFNLMKKN